MVRRFRLALALSLLSATALVALSTAHAGSEEEQRELIGPTPEVMMQPAVQAELERAKAEAEAAEQHRQEPEQVAARKRSRTLHSGLSDTEARQLAAETFPEPCSPRASPASSCLAARI